MSRKESLSWPKPWNDADHDGQLTMRMAGIELGKAGVKLSNKHLPSMTKGELLNERNNLRRVTNDFTSKADTALSNGDSSEADRLMKVAEETARITALISRQLDMNEIVDSSRGAEGSQFKSAKGDRVQVLAKGDSLSSLNPHDASKAGFGFGEFVASMVRGSDRTDIKNALAEGTDSAGGYTVPRHLMADLIDKMRAKTAVVRAGAVTIPLETQQTTIARIASDPAAGWRLENAAIAESDPTFEGVTFNARSLAVLVKISRELLDDSINIDQALTMAFAGAMAVEIDRVALFGSGTAPEPRGIFNTTNVNSVSMGTNGAQLINHGKLLDCLYEIDLDNGPSPTAQVMHPRTWRTIQGFTDSTGQPLQPPPALAALPSMSTTTVPITQTQGTASNASAVIVGDFTQLMIGVRQELRIEVLRERFADNNQYGFVAHLRADIAVAHPESFCKLVGIIP